jgi:mannose-6-phosphate isomerase-like protein (cupin superfamily)
MAKMAGHVGGDPLLCAIADVYAAEPRSEAAASAAALLSAPRGMFFQPQPACEFDLGIQALLASSSHPAAAAILAAQERIPWGTNPVADRVDAGFSSICAVATFMGPEGPVACPDYRLGLFYQRPETYYALHAHDADETYVILAGSALWTAGTDVRQRGAGELIHHPSLMPHAFRTGPDGLLALWRWSGDISVSSYVMLDDPEVLAG